MMPADGIHCVQQPCHHAASSGEFRAGVSGRSDPGAEVSAGQTSAHSSGVRTRRHLAGARSDLSESAPRGSFEALDGASHPTRHETNQRLAGQGPVPRRLQGDTSGSRTVVVELGSPRVSVMKWGDCRTKSSASSDGLLYHLSTGQNEDAKRHPSTRS
jgi:hypothetical protein